MFQGLYGAANRFAVGLIHRAIDVEIKLVEIFVPQWVITFVLSRIDRLGPPIAGRFDRLVLRRARKTDERLLKGAISKRVEEAEEYLSYKVAPIIIAGVERHVPDVPEPSRKVSTIIAGVGKYVPDHIIPTKNIEQWLKLKERFGISASMIDRLTGVRERRYAAEGEASSDMAVRASQQAIKLAGINPEDIDTIIFAAASQDLGEPATANIVQEKLGAHNAHVFDTKNACNSFVNAIDIMDAYIQTGRSRIGLVASGEVISKFINWNIDDKASLKPFLAGLTLGDGGGAMVLRAGNGGDSHRGIQGASFMTDGSQWRLATVTAGGNLYAQDGSPPLFSSHGAQLDRLASKYIPIALQRLLTKVGWKLDEVDLVISHQYSEQTITKIAQDMNFPISKCMLTVRKYGNTASASIPIALAEAMEEGIVGPGSKILLVGGAAGFSAGVVGIVL